MLSGIKTDHRRVPTLSTPHRITESQNGRGWKGPPWAACSSAPSPSEGRSSSSCSDGTSSASVCARCPAPGEHPFSSSGWNLTQLCFLTQRASFGYVQELTRSRCSLELVRSNLPHTTRSPQLWRKSCSPANWTSLAVLIEG